MSDVSYPQDTLTAKERELRDWLITQPGGAEWWFVVKSGFRRSYDMGVRDASKVSPTAVVDPVWFPDDQHGYSIRLCTCAGGAYVGARRMGTVDCCEVCGLITPGQFAFLRDAFLDAR